MTPQVETKLRWFLEHINEPLRDIVVECITALETVCERGYPCPHCDQGDEEHICICFDQVYECRENVAKGAEAMTRLQEFLK